MAWTHELNHFDGLYQPEEKFYYREPGMEETVLHIYHPAKCSGKAPAIVWFHGGGLTNEDTPEFPMTFRDGKYVMILVRYRLCPSVTPQDVIDDAAKAVAEVFLHADEWGIDPRAISVGGMSAGGYLSALVGMNPALLGKYGVDHKKILTLLLASGQMTTHFHVKHVLNYGAREPMPVIDEYAPLFYVSKDLPPILCATGAPGMDLPARPEENQFFAASLRAVGHTDVECYTFQDIPHCVMVVDCSAPYMYRFAEKYLAKLSE